MSDYNPDEKLIKKPSDDVPLTEEQAQEWIKCAGDFSYFCSNYVYVQGEHGRMLFNLREYQHRVMDNVMNNNFTISCLSRQVGKTVMFAAYILWKMTFIQDFQAGLSSYKNVNVLDFVGRIGFAYQCLPWWLKTPCVKFNQYSIAFSNGSSVYGQVTSETFGRGKSLSLIVLDELAFVDAKISNALMGSLIGSLSANGEDSNTELHIISTPNGTQGAYYEIWSSALSGDSEFSPIKIEYEEIPGRGPGEDGIDRFEQKMLRSGMSRDAFDQEFKLHFISSSGTLINSRLLESIQSEPPVREVGDFKLFTDSFRGKKVAASCDPSDGVGEDYSAIQIFDLETFEQLGEYANNMVNLSQLVSHMVHIIKLIVKEGAEDVYYCYESNSIGSGMGILFDSITDTDFDKATMISDLTRTSKGKTGMATTSKTKKEACGQFKDMVEMEKITLKSQRLLNELKTFVKKGAGFEAQSGNHDDRVSACLLFVRLLNELRNYEDAVDEMVSQVILEADESMPDIYF